MKKPVIHFIVLWSISLLGCHNPVQETIIRYESEKYQRKIHKPVTILNQQPFYASDSLQLLRIEATQFLQLKLEAIGKQRNELLANISKYEAECDSLKNNALKKTMLQIINGMQKRANHLEQIYFIYKNEPEKTQLQSFFQKMETYKNDSLLLLGLKVCAAFDATEGDLPKKEFQKQYLVNGSKSKVLGEFVTP